MNEWRRNGVVRGAVHVLCKDEESRFLKMI